MYAQRNINELERSGFAICSNMDLGIMLSETKCRQTNVE